MPEPARQLVNGNSVLVNYQIDQKGTSGVGRVEVWATADRGQSWQRLGEDPDRSSPVEVEFPGEGLFGLRLVVSNGRGFGGAPPVKGDTPDWWVEVDTTRPNAELGTMRPEGGAFVIAWIARDSNLGPEPIDLYYATGREGPWHPVASKLKNEGNYRWAVPRDAGPRAFIRLVVSDLAGNTISCETQEAVTLDDLSRPRGRMLGIAVNNTPRPVPSGGN
jgi:hypothetical protein